jgi:hypothetical protein
VFNGNSFTCTGNDYQMTADVVGVRTPEGKQAIGSLTITLHGPESAWRGTITVPFTLNAQ